jgi:alkanesulfonate monooxygenase SsuD/methylene tetrahydromethanopterin reductase-like flavin-dependent oxidoreductase (luciferase family)
MKIDFGVFDHLDRGDFPIGDNYQNRLRLIEAFDASGFYAYHLAEHHGTTLGIAPAPGVFLSAVAQRTERLRMGPMVYVLPTHDPLRLVEEICMLDQLSRGRFEIGIGRGLSPYELGCFGINHLAARRRFPEAFQVLLKGLTQEVLDFDGKYYTYTDIPLVLRTVQKPHPPLWYGVTRPESAVWTAKNRINPVMNGPSPAIRAVVERYRAEWRQAHGDDPITVKFGTTRHIYIAESDEKAEETARRAYEVWFTSVAELYRRYGTMPLHFPHTYDQAVQRDVALVGAPETVRRKLLRIVEESGVNYVMGRFFFGDMPIERVLNSVDLFAREVIPAFQATVAA